MRNVTKQCKSNYQRLDRSNSARNLEGKKDHMNKSGHTEKKKEKKRERFRSLSLSKTQLGRKDKEQHFKMGKYLWTNE